MRYASLFLFALLTPALVSAQDDPRIGVTISSPGSFGVIWNVNSAVAIRPEITLSRATGDSGGTDVTGAEPVTTQDATAVGVAVSGLVYFARKDALRPYVSPRFAYSRSSTSSSSDVGSVLGPSVSDSVISSYGGAGSLGAQYALGRRVSVFGELGGSYTRSTTTTVSTFTTTQTTIRNGILTQTTTQQTISGSAHVNTLSTRAAVGVIWYF